MEVAMLLEPVLMRLDGERPYQPQTALAIGEDAHDVSSAPDFLVQSLKHIGRFEVLVVLARQPVKEMLWGGRRGWQFRRLHQSMECRHAPAERFEQVPGCPGPR